MKIEFEKFSTDLAVRASGLMVTDQPSANRATELVLAGKDIIKKIRAFFMPLKDAAKASWQGLVDREKAELAKIEPIIEGLMRSVASWKTEEERKQWEAAAAARRDEEKRRQIEEEVLRKVQEAEERAERERLRLEEEAEKINREAAKKANNAAALKRITEEREKVRLQIEENRKRLEEATDKAIDKAAKAEVALAPVAVIPEAPKTEGLAMRNIYSFEVTDKVALPEEYKIADQSALNAMARIKKDEFKIPGGHVVNKPYMASTGKRG